MRSASGLNMYRIAPVLVFACLLGACAAHDGMVAATSA
jgi:hypothetical protein